MSRRFPRHAAVFALLFALAPACASEPEPCAIADNGDGTSTLRCGGESYVIPGGAGASDCTLVRGEDRSGIITCGDGTVVRLDADGNPIFPGTGRITGRAEYYGLLDHSGIVVRAPGTPFATKTNESGLYVLTDLPSATYTLVFEGKGRVSKRIDNITVLPGEVKLEQVTLMLGMEISPLPLGVIGVGESPRHDSFFVHDTRGSGSARLTIWDVESRSGTVLSATASGPSFSSDGKRLVFIEDRSSNGRVILWDVDGRRADELLAGASSCSFTPDGRTVAVWADDLVLIDVASLEQVRLDATRAWYAPDGRSVVYLDRDGVLSVWDIESRSLSTLRRTPSAPVAVRFTPDGRDAVIVDPSPEGLVVLRWDFDSRLETRWTISDDYVEFPLPPTDRYVAFSASDLGVRNVYFWVRGEDTPRPLTDRDLVASVLGDAAVLWTNLAVSPALSLYDVATGSTSMLATNVSWVSPSPDGQSALVVSNSQSEKKLIRLVGRKQVDLAEWGDFVWSPNGAWLRMTAGDELGLVRAATGRIVKVGAPVRPLEFTPSGTGLFFHAWSNDEPGPGHVGHWNLEAEQPQMLGPYTSNPYSSRSGRTTFIADRTSAGVQLFKVDPANGNREPIDFEGSDPEIHERFLLYQPAEKGTWLVTAFD